MTSALLVSHGFFGDNLFISSVAQKLIEEHQFDTVDFMTGFPQVLDLLQNNPYINQVYAADIIGPELKGIISQYDVSSYDKVFTYNAFSFNTPPALEAQMLSGVRNPSTEFTVWTNPTHDTVALDFINNLRNDNPNKKIIAWMQNWKQKAFKFTEQEYWNAPNHPLTGFGKENRDIEYIIHELSNDFIMIPVGVPEHLTQVHTAQYEHEYRTLSEDASILKQCDYFIGTEGGLANLAAGVGCKTILTYEFVWQCYGPRGTVRAFPNGPQLGPVHYFSAGHQYLPLYKTDLELTPLIKEMII